MTGKTLTNEADEVAEDAPWPLAYQMQAKLAQEAKFWTHTLYRGPEDKSIKIFYSKNKAESEVMAKMFLEEPV
jgi:hypothetical protein